jgi:lysophospholipase L1-like esterase
MRGSWAIVGCSLLACGSHKETDAGARLVDAPAKMGASDAKAVDAHIDALREASVDAFVAPIPPKHYKTVVHTGDSMVGGGLCKALAPRFKAEGTKFVRDVWESASISAFDDSDRLPTLMKHHNPDLVLLTLGANDVFNDHPEYMAKHIESIVKKVGHRDCIWIGPPLWKPDKGLVETIRKHAAPCRFYDSQHLVLQRAGDGIHPTDKGGEAWADGFWPFFKGEVDAGP